MLISINNFTNIHDVKIYIYILKIRKDFKNSLSLDQYILDWKVSYLEKFSFSLAISYHIILDSYTHTYIFIDIYRNLVKKNL